MEIPSSSLRAETTGDIPSTTSAESIIPYLLVRIVSKHETVNEADSQGSPPTPSRSNSQNGKKNPTKPSDGKNATSIDYVGLFEELKRGDQGLTFHTDEKMQKKVIHGQTSLTVSSMKRNGSPLSSPCNQQTKIGDSPAI